MRQRKKWGVCAIGTLFFLWILSQAYAQERWFGIFPQTFRKNQGYTEDETAGFVHKANIKMPPQKKTNNYGFIEEAPTPKRKKPGSGRILVTGDSHVDGIVATDENFPNVLETVLNREDPRRTYEVINGGVGFYTFTNYAGFLKKFIFLEPDIFVVVIYLGNDFLGVAQGLAAAGEIEVPRQEDYLKTLGAAGKINPGAVCQHLNQVFYFKRYPEMFERVLEVSRSALDDILERSTDQSIRVIWVLLPTKLMMESPQHTGVAEVANVLGLTREDVSAFDKRAKDSLTAWVRARNVECLDLTEAMRSDPRELFYKKDYHLNVAGHQVLAKIFYDRYGKEILSWREGKSREL